MKNVRYQEAGGEAVDIESFTPGYINGSFNMDLTSLETEENAHGSFALYFDIINTTDIQWTIVDVELPTTLTSQGVSASYSGVIATNNLTDTDSDGYKNFDASTPIDGSLILTITAPNSSVVDLEGIIVTIDEYIEPVVYVTSVTTENNSTQNTLTQFNGPSALIDLSSIEFATGETTLTISMTSLSANYIKNKVSWVNTSGVTISSTSLYLPKNPSEELTSGESKDLTITVNNNTGSATTISGLEVEFADMGEYLLQVTSEGEVSEYTGEGYWYVEMGTYSTTSDNAEGKRESEYLRWRYFAEEETPYNADTETAPVAYHYEFDRNTRPTGEGYFILESYFSSFESNNEGGLYCSWNNDYLNASPFKHQLNGWKNIDANDYSTSNIRQYMNSEELVSKYYDTDTTYAGTVYSPSNNASYMSNMFTDLHIDPDNDIVYTQIIGRTLGDLYTDMSSSATNPQDVDFPKGSPDDWTGATITYSREDTDKFWLLSYYEAYTLLSGNGTTSSDTDREWGYSYWLRSPYLSISYAAYGVSTSGNIDNGSGVYNDGNVARAAFKFSVDEL